MDQQIQKIIPNYRLIYSDILHLKFPEKKYLCKSILSKQNLNAMDIMELNKKLFGCNKESNRQNQKYSSYSQKDVVFILDYQKKYNLNNSQLAKHFNISRNTVAKWKKRVLAF